MTADMATGKGTAGEKVVERTAGVVSELAESGRSLLWSSSSCAMISFVHVVRTAAAHAAPRAEQGT